jgi:DnaJ-class molecular chaperone
MISQMQSACEACDGQGKSFQRKSEREILEVHIQKGAPPDHKVVFREKADEHPDHDTGDIVFILKEQSHKEFKRRGADLFIERTISLVEALCGFELEVTQLDGRKLLIKTEPGDIVCPAPTNFDPLAAGEKKSQEWECIDGFDAPDAENVAQAQTCDTDTIKKAIETQLKKQGISVEGFVCDGRTTYFKRGTRAELLKGKKAKGGCSLWVAKDPNANSGMRMIKAVKGEGMPTYKNPSSRGNLFLLLTIQFPDKLAVETQEALRKLLPPPLQQPTVTADSDDVDVVKVVNMDPVESFQDSKYNMQTHDGDASESEEDDGGGAGSFFRGMFR